MRWQAIFFDLDGTLVPMDTDVFTKGYFGILARTFAEKGYDPEALIKSIWAGTKAMMTNEGAVTNEKAFWDTFSAVSGLDADTVNRELLGFYGNEFNEARVFTGENPLASEAVDAARKHADQVVLASNPLFPRVALEARASWVGLSGEDFDFIASYDNQRFCKPRPEYYASLCEQLGLEPARCLMVGNDELDDMHAATTAGMQGYLVTDIRVTSEEHPWSDPAGTLEDFTQWLEN